MVKMLAASYPTHRMPTWSVDNGRVDPPGHPGRPLVRTGLAELPHPAPDSYDKIYVFFGKVGNIDIVFQDFGNPIASKVWENFFQLIGSLLPLRLIHLKRIR